MPAPKRYDIALRVDGKFSVWRQSFDNPWVMIAVVSTYTEAQKVVHDAVWDSEQEACAAQLVSDVDAAFILESPL